MRDKSETISLLRLNSGIFLSVSGTLVQFGVAAKEAGELHWPSDSPSNPSEK
jgi:hypothetical protein